MSVDSFEHNFALFYKGGLNMSNISAKNILLCYHDYYNRLARKSFSIFNIMCCNVCIKHNSYIFVNCVCGTMEEQKSNNNTSHPAQPVRAEEDCSCCCCICDFLRFCDICLSCCNLLLDCCHLCGECECECDGGD